MIELTESDIQNLINCEKKILKAAPSKGFNSIKRSRVREFDIESIDKQYVFSVFARQNEIIIENFSIGLKFKPKNQASLFERTIVILRYNGAHGAYDFSIDGHYSNYHIHSISKKYIDQGIYEARHITVTDKYNTFELAFNEFLKDINIINRDKYLFPNIAPPLPFKDFNG